jgi:threonine/homoserine/homoserine lactone efflux protein
MPVAGPTAALVFARALERRAREAWLIALGSAVPEGLYACLACWGVAAALGRFPALVGASRLAGGIVLGAVGIWLLARASTLGGSVKGDPGTDRGIFIGLAMTLVNPTLLLTWTAAVSALHSVGLLPVDTRSALPFALGVAAGVSAWFAVMIRLVAVVRERVRGPMFAGILRSVGALFVVAGVLVVAHTVVRKP